MPRDNSIKKVLVIGSGPIVIGQAAEFDYAGTQACRSLKEEGIEVVLLNSNPATIMTDKDIADRVYIEPLTVEVVEQLIKKEKPDSVLPTLGGQAGLNLGMELAESGFLEEHGVKLIGQEKELNIRKILCNPNVIAMIIGIALFALEIRLPTVVDSCVSGFGDMISPASMMVIGMVIGDVDLKWVFHQKRPYLICLLRLIVFPLIAVFAFAVLERSGIHPDAEYILMIVLIATSAPAAAMITQLAQIYGKDSRYASVINVMSVIFCIITMPVMVLSYEMLIAL